MERERKTAPASWTRVQSLVADLCGALIMLGQPMFPSELAAIEERVLRSAGARVLRDLGGHPCVRLDDPVVVTWLAGIDTRIARIERDLDAAMEAVRD